MAVQQLGWPHLISIIIRAQVPKETAILMSEEIRSGSNTSVSTVTIPISGMTCAACVTHVESALRELPDISAVSVNLASEKAILKSNVILPPITQIESALDNAGYGLQTITSTIGIEGMTCSACVSHVEGAI